LSFRCK